jgi:hypothetical protein
MIQASLRRLHSPNVFDLKNYAPQEGEPVGLLIQAMIGPHNGSGEESFDFVVCTPEWLASQMPESGYTFGRHHLVVRRYDYATIWSAIEDLCNQATGQNWHSVAAFLNRYGKWEFEDYR